MKLALVVADFNYEVTSKMEERARTHAESLGVEVGPIVHVAGVFDTPLAVKMLLERAEIDGVVIIGAAIRGETTHDEVVVRAAARAAVELALEYGKPVGLGVTGPRMTRAQALERIENARNAMDAVIRMVRTVRELGG